MLVTNELTPGAPGACKVWLATTLPSRVSLMLWMNRGMAPVFVTVRAYVVGSVGLDSPVNGVAARLHSGKFPTTKSERVAVGLCDERVSAMKASKQPPSPS